MKYIKNYKIFEKNQTSLSFSDWGYRELPELPPNLEILYCDSNKLTTLPELPKTLRILNCNNNRLEELPELPPNLEELYCHTNNIFEIPKLPNTLTLLSFAQNSVEYLPELPKSLKTLYCHENNLKELPELPPKLERLYCTDNNWDIPLRKDVFKYFYDNEKIYTPDQKVKFSSYKFQKKFLIEYPERFQDLSCGGIKVNPIIRKEFDYLFEGEDMGFFNLKTKE